MDISVYVKALKFYRVYLIVWLWESHVTSKRSHGWCVLRVFSLKVKARSVFFGGRINGGCGGFELCIDPGVGDFRGHMVWVTTGIWGICILNVGWWVFNF